VERTFQPASLTLRDSLVEQTRLLGIYVAGASADIERSVVRGALPDPVSGSFGRGINIEGECSETPTGVSCDPTQQGSAIMRGSVIENNHEYGIYAAGGDLTLEGSVVHGTQPRASDQRFGHGVAILIPCLNTAMGQLCDASARATALVQGSLVADNHTLGVFVMGSDATVASTVIRATRPRAADQEAGRGLLVQLGCIESPTGLGLVCDPEARANATLRSSLIEDNHDVGVFIGGADATLETSVVRRTLARPLDGLFGDGVAVYSEFAPSSASLTSVSIEQSARAGLSNFGGAASVGATRIQCAAFGVAGEALAGQDFSFDDRGDTLCGCPDATEACHAVSSGLLPPEQL
jgi:hypothetical protein